MHPKIIFAKFQTHANVIPSTTLLIILIWRRYPDVETRERNERAWRECDAVGCHSNAVSFYYLWYGAIKCVPQKRKPINRVNFSENCNDLSEKAYILQIQFIIYLLTPVTRCIGHAKYHWPFSNGMSKMICALYFSSFNGVATFQISKGRVDKTFIGISFGLLRFFCLDSFWDGLSMNLVILLHTIILRKSFLTCMNLNCFLSTMHWDIIMCLVSNERRENALDNQIHFVSILRGNEDISLIKRVSFLLGRTVYIIDSIPTNTNIEQMYVYARERSERA